jgi:hypothetical protein
MSPRARLFVAFAGLLIAVHFSAGSSYCETIISNLNGNDMSQSANLSPSRNKGMAFTMPVGAAYHLDRVTLRLRPDSLAADPTVQLWSNDATAAAPVSPLITLNNPTINATGINNYEFSPPSPFVLQADTTYWIVVFAKSSSATIDWMADFPGIIPTGIAAHYYQLFDGNGPPPTGGSQIWSSYAVSGALVCEPTTMGIGFLVMAPLAIGGSRRRSSPSVPC